jgi:hypothetical protein
MEPSPNLLYTKNIDLSYLTTHEFNPDDRLCENLPFTRRSKLEIKSLTRTPETFTRSAVKCPKRSTLNHGARLTKSETGLPDPLRGMF